MTSDVNCIYADMPPRIKAYTVPNSDMSFTIVLNSRLSREQLMISYHHELCHIKNGDYDKKYDADMLEIIAHGTV